MLCRDMLTSLPPPPGLQYWIMLTHQKEAQHIKRNVAKLIKDLKKVRSVKVRGALGGGGAHKVSGGSAWGRKVREGSARAHKVRGEPARKASLRPGDCWPLTARPPCACCPHPTQQEQKPQEQDSEAREQPSPADTLTSAPSALGAIVNTAVQAMALMNPFSRPPSQPVSRIGSATESRRATLANNSMLQASSAVRAATADVGALAAAMKLDEDQVSGVAFPPSSAGRMPCPA
jgi:hypothetical protein